MSNANNCSNLPEQTTLLAETKQNDSFSWVTSWFPGSIVRFMPHKYIERIEIEFATAVQGAEFEGLTEDMWWHYHFITENVRWTRSDTYLTVIGVTFVRWKPVED